MAIPIYVPEEYGPLPTQTAWYQAPATSRSSFVHQLIEELYTIYQEYCAVSDSAPNRVSIGEQNNNVSCVDLNNSRLELHPSGRRSRDKCHTIGHGHRQHGYVTQQKSYPDYENNCKLTRHQSSNVNNVGLQLRQVADSFGVSNNQYFVSMCEQRFEKFDLSLEHVTETLLFCNRTMPPCHKPHTISSQTPNRGIEAKQHGVEHLLCVDQSSS